jgi:dCTP deaminase
VASRRQVGRSRPLQRSLAGSALSRPDIFQRLEKGDLRFSPEIEAASIKQCSIDLRLGRTFTVFKNPEGIAAFAIGKAKVLFENAELWEQREEERLILRPKKLVLGQTLEVVYLPNDLMGLVEGRSSWARFGVSVHITAPKIDPGYHQPITLELFNHSESTYELEAGVDQPCQLMFFRLSTELKPEEAYGHSADDIFAEIATPIPVKKGKAKAR